MYTDWVLVQRVALELGARFSGARVQSAGHLSDGRFALELWTRGSTRVLAFDLFAATPVVTLEDADLSIETEPGFLRRAGAALRGMSLGAVRSRKGDRVLRLDFGTRSRFGVQSGYSLIAELVPKFGNLLLIKDHTIVGALKEFSAAQNARRSIEAGAIYEAPPLDLEPRATQADLAVALRARERGGEPRKAEIAALRAVRPLLPQQVAVSLLTQAGRDTSNDHAALAAHLVQEADAFLASLDGLRTLPVIEYRDRGKLIQAHVAELHQFDRLERQTGDSILASLAQARAQALDADLTDRVEKRRRSLARALADRDKKLRADLGGVMTKLEQSAARDTLREQGEAIFATLHERDAAGRDEAKSRAAELFAKYKKVSTSIPHLTARRDDLERGLEVVAELQWEVERATAADLDDVAQAVAQLDSRGKPPVPKRAAKKRKPLVVTTSSGSRILIGRSPVENAELTFRVARPDDLWFHTQKIPGAHVILQRDDKQAPPPDDLAAAAAYAAFYSKAKNSPSVIVDYTQRKHVRKQPAAPPGLVFYTNPKSISVAPREPAS